MSPSTTSKRNYLQGITRLFFVMIRKTCLWKDNVKKLIRNFYTYFLFILYVILLSTTDPYLTSLCTLVPHASCYVFYGTRHVNFRFDTDDMAFASTVIWYHTQIHLHTQIHTETNRLTHKYILKPPVMCSQRLFVLNWMKH